MQNDTKVFVKSNGLLVMLDVILISLFNDEHQYQGASCHAVFCRLVPTNEILLIVQQ